MPESESNSWMSSRAVVEQVLVAERGADREPVLFGEGLDVGAGLRVPAAAPENNQGRFGRLQQLAEGRHVLGRRRTARDLVRADVGHVDLVDQHVLRQHQHDRARPAVEGHGEGLGDVFGDAPGVLDLGHPLGQLAVHAAVVDLLEGLAVGRLAGDLADQQDHGCRILEAGMHSHRGIGGARAAGHEADARPAGQLAVGLRHIGGAALLAADDVADRVALGVQRVECGEVTLAGDAEDGVDTIDAQLVDQDLRAAAGSHGRSLTSWVRRRWAPISCCSWSS